MNSIILTANQRLAFYLNQQNATNAVFFKTWLTQTYNQLESNQFLLSDAQERVLWETIIAQTCKDTHPELILLSTRGLSKTAHAAFHLLKKWNISLSSIANFPSSEVQIFYEWAVAFEQRCRVLGCIDSSSAVNEILKALSEGRLVLDRPMLLVGFDTLYPQLEKLQDYFRNEEDRATKIPGSADITSIRIENEEAELYAMAQWAYQLQQSEPDTRIGCVIPQLSTLRHQVQYIFDQIFEGGSPPKGKGYIPIAFEETDCVGYGISRSSCIPKYTPSARPLLPCQSFKSFGYNLSGGQKFDTLPLIKTAFDILQLAKWGREDIQLDINRLSYLLRSPFLGGSEQELMARSVLDVRLRETQEPVLYRKTFNILIQDHAECPIFYGQCEQYFEHFNAVPVKQSVSKWAEYFSEGLACMGWPGERILNSSEYQQMKRWTELLEELSSLNTVLSHSLSKREAINRLQQLAQSVLFQPETPLASVQVLGLLETIDLPFDAIWVSGMTQEDWPGNASANPFIPIALQRQNHMPHASAEWEMEYSQRLTAYFCNNIPQVMFSYVLHKEDRPQMPSALIAEFPVADIGWALAQQQKTFKTRCWAKAQPTPPESLSAGSALSDIQAPPVSKTEILRGGAAILKHQAACPFKAFATVRLGAAKLPETHFYLTPAERGTHLHAALDKIWRKLKDQKTLLTYDEPALDALLQPLVRQVLMHAAQRRPFALRSNLLKLEEQRLVQRLKNWLSVEKTRPSFKVLASEVSQTVEFAGLSLKLRLDRKDQLENGEEIILDYKTGLCSAAQWQGDRPDEPQLLLYGLTTDEPVSGLIFAQILADKLTFIGIGADNYEISGVAAIESWQSFLTDRQKTLTRIAHAFQTGHAAVDPKSPQTCYYCDLQPLCRVFEKKT